VSVIRYCPLRDEKVIVAVNRLHRPVDYQICKAPSKENIQECPFEKGKEELTPGEVFSVRKDGEWLVRVVPNLYHALSVESEKRSYRKGFFEYEEGVGAHEVIIENPDHFKRFKDYSVEEFKNYLFAIKSRILDLSNDKRLEYISVFKNQGLNAGATLSHPHSQIIATPFIPKEIREEIERKRRYYASHKRALLRDIITEEMREEKRIVEKNSDFVSFVPFASLYPFETIIAPLEDISSIAFLDERKLISLCEILQKTFKRLYRVLGDFDFNVIYKNSPPVTEQFDSDYFYKMDKFYVFYIQIIPRLYKLAGFEMGTNMRINPISSESAAKQLKNI